jgi:cell division protease FtsH
MVTEWGMSEKLGPLRYSENEEEVFLGHSVTQRKNISDATAKLIDEEIRDLVEGGERRAREILTEHLEDLHNLAKALLEHETLSADEIARLLKGEKIVRPDQDEPKDTGHRTSVPTSRGRKEAAPPGGMTPEPQPGA